MNKTLKIAIEKFNNSEYFACHDILEDYWYECRQEEKDFYQGLLHFAVAFHHLFDKKNPAGAKLQFKKCIDRLISYDKEYEGIDTKYIIKRSKKNLALIESGKSDEIINIKIKVK